MLRLLFYWGSIATLFVGLFYLKKTEKDEEIFEGVVLTTIIEMSFQALIMGIFKLIHLPVNCCSIGLVNFVTGSILLYGVFKRLRRQKYIFIVKDGIANLIFLCLITVWSFGRFGIGLDWFHYETVDMGRHVLEALIVADNQSVRGMYFGQGQVGIWYQSLKFFSVPAYQVAIIFESMILYLVISSFWSVIRRYITSKGSWITAFILSCLYFFGYPVCGEIFGSQYLVCGLMLVTALITIFIKYSEDLWERNVVIMLLMLIANGLVVCYVQFCPVVFSALGIGIIIKERKLKNIIITGFSVFIIPCISAFYFILIGALKGLGISGGLALEGYIYRDLYSDFLLILPFAVWKLLADIKNKKISIESLLFTLSGICIIIFFIGVLKGDIQGYYYYKNYYLMWICAWVLASAGILVNWKEIRIFIVGFATIWGSMAMLHFTGSDQYLANNYFIINQSTKSGVLFEIYDWNKEHYRNDGGMSKMLQELYKESGKLANQTQKMVPVICPKGGFVFSYYALTEQLGYEQYIFEDYGMDDFWNKIQGCEYLTVWYVDGSETYLQYVDTWQRVYENEEGYIVKVQKPDLAVEFIGMYGSEGTGENIIRWGEKTGNITYTNPTNQDMERVVNFEIIGVDNIEENSNVVIEIDGKKKKYFFDNKSIRCNLSIVIPANESKSIIWKANVEPVSLEKGRKLYIAFKNYDTKWDTN